MDENQIKIILRKVKNGVITIDKAVQDFKDFPYKELGFAKVDTHRAIRCGFPEVILCEGKTADQVVKIAEQIVNSGANLLATRFQ